LMESFGYQPSFVSLNGTIGFSFHFEHPFASYWILGAVWRYKGPCLVMEKSIKLKLHCISPFWNTHSI
jgi:hypothetical protein